MAVRVLWVVKGLGPGGAERLLVAAARAHDRTAVQIDCAYVLSMKDHLVAALEEAGVRCTCLSHSDRDPRWLLRLREMIAQGSYDIVHVHSPVPGSAARVVARSLPPDRRPAIVSTEHNTWDRHRAATRTLNTGTSRWNDLTYAVSEETRASMAGLASARAQVLTHGIDVAEAASQKTHRPAVRAELGLAPDDFVIGTIANMTAQKDYPNLLRAAQQLVEAGVSARVVAVGQGPLEGQVRAMVQGMGLGRVVVLTGFRDDAVRVLGACDMFTLASAWEGLPVALMEALALGLPVVATRVGGVAEVLHDGADALLVPAGDPQALASAWARVASDDDLRARLAAAAASRAPEFDVSRTVQRIEDGYQGLASARGAAVAVEHPDEPTPRHRRALPAGLKLRHAEDRDREAILALVQRSLGSPDPRYADLFAWKHDDNAFGKSPMWVAVDQGRVVAFRTFLRWEFVRGGEVLRAVRAVDTATDPDHQGRGLFRALTERAVDEMRDEGVAFVFNTPNDQSRPGYLRMGWRDVGRVPSAFRAAHPAAVARLLRARVPADRWSVPTSVGEPVADWLSRRVQEAYPVRPRHVREIATNMTEPYLRWRFGLPLLHYRVVDDEQAAVVLRCRRRGPATELGVVAVLGDRAHGDRLAGRVLRQAGADYALRTGPPAPRLGYVPLPGGGPRLTWRGLSDLGMPPLANWALSLGDLELF